jgi:hypothetical protein
MDRLLIPLDVFMTSSVDSHGELEANIYVIGISKVTCLGSSNIFCNGLKTASIDDKTSISTTNCKVKGFFWKARSSKMC